MHQTEAAPLSAAQKMTIDIAIESLEFLKEVSNATDTAIVALTREDLEQFVKREVHSKESRPSSNQRSLNPLHSEP